LWHRSDGRGLEQPTWDALARHFDESQLIEVLMVVGSYVGLAGFLNAVELEREAGVPGLPWTPKVGATLRAVLPLIEQKSDRAFLDRMPRHHASKLEHIVNAYTTSRSIPSTPLGSSTSSPTTTPSSPSTPGCATSGRRATSPRTADAG
jgi:hypothetical protein